ncbi:hypothetical protein P3T43_007048 [Paraburkholderia sp. GAS41]|jgi:hypothetical protein
MENMRIFYYLSIASHKLTFDRNRKDGAVTPRRVHEDPPLVGVLWRSPVNA